ncbi:LOW QUALITY PROTEIN: retinol dehydrogenase 8 [Carassius carassius]|uniref:LOW QUALITY PROTEIN: retinol dehydrogenase 8 n=1 Tax=Carassius carassius TaxID=217509 RepID=UPI0028685519|nr:LOW QUALITY PROTEIN: retinol dehydrogenase 8 [Carassius carassius]
MGTRKVLVTGSSSGIGLALAVRLAKDKLRRFKGKKTLERTAGKSLNISLEIRQLDATCEDSIRECVNSLTDRQVEWMLNKTGVGMIGPLECQNVSAMQELFNTNFFGLVRLVKELLHDMKRCQSGHIIVMGSVLGIQGLLFNDVYAASKFAVEGFCESLAVQAMKFNVNMTLVEPGPVVTEFEKKVYEEAEKMDLSETDEETARIFRQIYLKYSHEVFYSVGQTPKEVAEKTLQLIVSKNPPFRHQTNRLYRPLTATKHAEPTGHLPIDPFYKLIFQHDHMFNASLSILRILHRRMGAA